MFQFQLLYISNGTYWNLQKSILELVIGGSIQPNPPTNINQPCRLNPVDKTFGLVTG